MAFNISIIVLSIGAILNLQGCNAKLRGEGGYKDLNDVEKNDLFAQFIQEYQRNYTNEEYNERFEIFKSNLLHVDFRNEKEKQEGGSAIHGVTRFADLTIEECTNTYFGAKINDNDMAIVKEMTNSEYKALPTSLTFVNWAGLYTTAVKNQGGCGSCWAFSATEQVESDSIRLLGWNKNSRLSPQQLVDCVTANAGCNGGNMVNTYAYLQTSGIELLSAYPYTATKNNCGFNSQYAKLKVKTYTFLNYNDPTKYTSTEINMANYVLNTGPLSVYVDATAWLSYTSGILASCTTNINHLAQIVGVDVNSKYWIVSI